MDSDIPHFFFVSIIRSHHQPTVVLNHAHAHVGFRRGSRLLFGRSVSGLLRYDGDELVASKYLEKELRDLQAFVNRTHI